VIRKIRKISELMGTPLDDSVIIIKDDFMNVSDDTGRRQDDFRVGIRDRGRVDYAENWQHSITKTDFS
jgi:hypothetical protein